MFNSNFSYDNLLKRGIRIALRAKVNDSLITGIRVVDSILPVGRGQRQLILGDRYTGKTSLFLSTLLQSSSINMLASIDGLGTKRLFGLYCGVNMSLSKASSMLERVVLVEWSSFWMFSQSSSSQLLASIIPAIGTTIAERLRDRGMDSLITFDDLSKHSRSIRQLSLLQNKIPSRDAYPSDIFNIHSSLLERVAYGV